MMVDQMHSRGSQTPFANGSLSFVCNHLPSSTTQMRTSILRKFRETTKLVTHEISALAFLLCLCGIQGTAQVTPGKLTFALPEHPGRMTLEQGAWQVLELSAKPNGNEWGERAAQGKQHMLAFLFVVPEKASLNAGLCRDETLKAEHAEAAVQDRASIRSADGVDIAIAVLINPKDANMSLRAFVASEDLCGDLLFDAADVRPGDKEAYRLTMETAKQTLRTLTFDPRAKPTFQDAFAYATAEYMKQQYAGAALAFRAALAMVSQSEDPLKFRRVITDNLSMSLGISGDLRGSREVNEAAIKKDPEYPLYYYNLACADAESGDPKAALIHLQQAFDRRTHGLNGEPFPDPTADDSLQKLRNDKPFWSLAQQVSRQVNPGKNP
jgi:tetratricopeptide (TPR) repeat protein